MTWKATTPPGTAVSLRVRTGDSIATMGSWSAEFTKSPAEFGPTSTTPISPNPAPLLEVEFTLSSSDKNTTPTLHEYGVGYLCADAS